MKDPQEKPAERRLGRGLEALLGEVVSGPMPQMNGFKAAGTIPRP